MRRVRNHLVPILLALIAAIPAKAAQGWNWQNPLPQGNDLWGVNFVDASTGFAVGNNGTVVKTLDGGTSWMVLPCIPGTWIRGVHFPDPDVGFAVGSRGPLVGVILRTDDGGMTWQEQLAEGRALQGVHFLDAQMGLAVGEVGTLWWTTNGGNSWVSLPSGTIETLSAAFMLDSATALAIGQNVSRRTTDAGSTWTAVAGSGVALDFADSQLGLSVRLGTVRRTTDGGATWTSSSVTTATLVDVEFLDAQEAMAAASNGAVLRSSDGGVTWVPTGFADAAVQRAAAYVEAGRLVTVGATGSTWLSTDDGLNWSPIHRGTTESLYGVATSGSKAVVVGTGGTIATSDDWGLTWTERNGGTSAWLFAVDLLGDGTGIAVGQDALLRTVDAGVSWRPLTGPAGVSWFDVVLHDASSATIVGDDSIYTTTDGGISWTPKHALPAGDFFGGLTFTDAGVGFAVTYLGRILRSLDGGSTWATQFHDGTLQLTDVDFPDELHGHACAGADGIGYARTFDGGSTWIREDAPLGAALEAIEFTSVASGSAASAGRVLRTEDGGTTWVGQPAETGTEAWNLAFFDASTAVMVGGAGTILRTTTAGYPTPVSVEAVPIPPSRIDLEQNHPNPFNASTRLTFRLEHAGHVRLDVHDVAGRLVTTLIDEPVTRGSHQAIWYGRDFRREAVASGMYFARLQALNEVVTVRMVLVK